MSILGAVRLPVTFLLEVWFLKFYSVILKFKVNKMYMVAIPYLHDVEPVINKQAENS